MDRQHVTARYTTKKIQDNNEGWIGLELIRSQDGETVTVTRVIYWDAQGQWALEPTACEVPLVIIEALIAEARSMDDWNGM